jgi:hypothetical protein
MWCLLLMIASGFAMFLAARAGSRLARISLAAGCCIFTALYLRWSSPIANGCRLPDIRLKKT